MEIETARANAAPPPVEEHCDSVLPDSGEMGCVDREECSNGAVAKGQTGRASGKGKQQTLGHELADAAGV